MKRVPELQQLVDRISKQSFGRTLTDSQDTGICVMCGETAGDFKNELSEKEYNISGMCQVCQDAIFRRL